MPNLKSITDLPIAESAEGLNLIVNDNGAAKQIAASAIGVSSWNDLADKPFVTEGIPDTLTWDGNTDGLPTFNVGVGVYKVSDVVLTEDDVMNGCSATWCDANGENQRIDGKDIKIRSYQGALFPEIFTGAFNAPMLVSGTSEILRNAFGCDVPSGTYFTLISDFDPSADGQYLSSITIPGYTSFVIERLDEKCMPVLTSPSGKKFKLSVDDSGAVTATEV